MGSVCTGSIINKEINEMKKRIITVVGKDSVGITAKVCVYLANNQINILDISQTIVAGYFNMMMVVDTQESSKIKQSSSHQSSDRSEKRLEYR